MYIFVSIQEGGIQNPKRRPKIIQKNGRNPRRRSFGITLDNNDFKSNPVGDRVDSINYAPSYSDLLFPHQHNPYRPCLPSPGVIHKKRSTLR